MNRRMTIWLALVVLLLEAPLMSGAAAGEQKEKKKRDRYSAVVMGTGGAVGGRTTRLTFTVEEYTTDEQVVGYLTILQEQGQDKLRRTLEKVKVGRVSPTGRVGGDLAVARIFDTENGKLLRLVAARNMPFLELYWGGRSTNYPFAIFEFHLDEEGRGQGAIMGGARVKFNKENKLEIESYGHQYLKLSNVRKDK